MVHVGNVVVHSAKPLDILAKGLTILLWNQVEVARLSRRLMAPDISHNKHMAQVRPRRMEFSSKSINQDLTLDLSTNGK